jgi:hypothetical protein
MRSSTIAAIALFGLRTVHAFEPPKIVSTSPKCWESGVPSASLKAVSITFDQTMRSGFWDFLGNNTLSPQTNYDTTMGADLKSFGLQVTLEPGRVYIMGLNERGIPGVGFQNEKGISLRPTYLVFQTAGNPAAEDAPPRALRTFPANGAQDVNPATTKGITVTFDRAMEPKKHGFHLVEAKHPVDLKAVTFAYSSDGRAFTLNYALRPSTHYEVQMNSTEDIGFAAATRVPLWPVHFAFTTGQPH